MNPDRPPSSSLTAPHVSVTVITPVGDPALLAQVLAGRAVAFAAARQPRVGEDDLDPLSLHVVATDARGEVVAAVRVAPGSRVLPARGPGAFVTSHYFSFTDAGVSFASEAAEASRLWITPECAARRRVLMALWLGMVEAVQQTGGMGGLFGVVSLVDYPAESLAILADILRRYYYPDRGLVVPFHPYPTPAGPCEATPLPAGGVVRELARAFRRVDRLHPFPPVLYEYLAKGAVLAGEPGWDWSGTKFVVPLAICARHLNRSAQSLMV